MMCMIDDAEPCEVWNPRWVTARKIHKCEECRREIQPGERYRYVFAVFQGDPNSHHTCSHCMRAGEWLEIVCGGWLTEGLWEELNDHMEEYPCRFLAIARAGVQAGWTGKNGRLWNLLGKPIWYKLRVPGVVEAECDRARDRWINHWMLWSEWYERVPA